MVLCCKSGLGVIVPVCLHSNAMGCHFMRAYISTVWTYFLVHYAYKQHILITMIKFTCLNLERNVLFFVTSHHRLTRNFTTLDPTCVAGPFIRLVLSEPLCRFESNICTCFVEKSVSNDQITFMSCYLF